MIRHERLNKTMKSLSRRLNLLGGYLRNYLLTGVFVLIPVAVTLYIIYFVFQFTDGFLGKAIGEAIGHNIPGMGIFLTALICLLIGIIAQNYFGKRLISWVDTSLSQIPIVKSVYSGIKQLADVFAMNKKSSFKRVVMLEYPKSNSWVIGFVTSDFILKVDGDIPEKDNMVTIFVPTTPNPTSGFLLIVPKSKVFDMNLDIEDAMKVIISGGLVQPVHGSNPALNANEAIIETEYQTEESGSMNAEAQELEKES